MVVEIFVTQSQTVEPLANQTDKPVRAARTTPFITQRTSDRLAQTQALIGQAK